jgi:hypothetical protein
MGRPPIGNRAMSASEGMRRRRLKLAEEAKRTQAVIRVGDGRGFVIEAERAID